MINNNNLLKYKYVLLFVSYLFINILICSIRKLPNDTELFTLIILEMLLMVLNRSMKILVETLNFSLHVLFDFVNFDEHIFYVS